jgi:hypothetical membrane protein
LPAPVRAAGRPAFERLAGGPRILARLLLAGGVVGPLLFVAAILAQDLTRPGYDPTRQFISVLGLGEAGWIQAANFIASGLLLAGFGVALGSAPGLGLARWVPTLIVVTGLALAIGGLFPSDPQLGYPYWISAAEVANPSLHSRIHFAAGFVGTVAFAGVFLADALAARAANAPRRVAYALASVAVMLACFLAGLRLASPGIGVPAIGGVLQRIGLVAGLQWLVWLAWTALRRSDSHARTSVRARREPRISGASDGAVPG